MRILPLLALGPGPVPLPATETMDFYFNALESGQAAPLVTHYHTETATWSRKRSGPHLKAGFLQPAFARRGSFTAKTAAAD